MFDRQADRVYRTAMVLMKNQHDAEDIVQSVFLTVLEKDIQFDSPEHEKAWFIVTTRNRCKDVLKSYWRKSVDLKDEDINAGELTSAEIEHVHDHDKELAEHILEGLSDVQREIVLLHYYEGYTVKEVAEMLELKESSVRSAISSAKRAINKLTVRKN